MYRNRFFTAIISSFIIISMTFSGCTKKEGGSIRIPEKDDNAEGRKVTKENSKFLGKYSIRMTGFIGDLTISNDGGKLKGEIRFANWGGGQSQVLKKMSITGSKIYFVRSISTKEELVRFGGKRFFKQEFHGQFSSDGSVVKGYFKDSGGQNSWEGKR